MGQTRACAQGPVLTSSVTLDVLFIFSEHFSSVTLRLQNPCFVDGGGAWALAAPGFVRCFGGRGPGPRGDRGAALTSGLCLSGSSEKGHWKYNRV